jgi:NADH-quinone oxidoreductase subunit N
MDMAAFASGLKPLAPEIVLLAAAAGALFVHLFGGRRGPRAAGWVSLAGMAAAGAALFWAPLSGGSFYAGSLLVDPFAVFIKVAVLAAGALTVVLSFRFFGVERYEPGEIYILLPLAMIGMTVSASTFDLISTYVAFELFAVTSYILAGLFKKERRSSEAGIKYFFLGTLSSGLMLLGMALIFGLTGETNYGAIARGLATADSHFVLTGMVLFFSGLFFKAAMVPFHMWAPDVYEGAATPMTVFLSTAPKAAVFAVLIRVMTGIFASYQAQWSSILLYLAVLTMFWGNLAALTQKNLKRMMAYSSIAHSGYIAIGLAAWGEQARAAVLFYIFVYVFMNAAAFGLILFVRRGKGFGEDVDSLRGLARKSPLAATAIVIILLSLAGIPPTAGFMGKYFLFLAAVDKGLIVLAAAGAVNSVISLFYYFRIGRALFMEDPSGGVTFESSLSLSLVLALSALVCLVLGILPALLSDFAAASVLGR